MQNTIMSWDIETTMPTPIFTEAASPANTSITMGMPQPTLMQVQVQSADQGTGGGLLAQSTSQQTGTSSVTANFIATAHDQIYVTGSNVLGSKDWYVDYKRMEKRYYKQAYKTVLCTKHAKKLGWYAQHYTSSSTKIDYQVLGSYTGVTNVIYQGDWAAGWPNVQVYSNAYPQRPETPEEKAAREAAEIKYQLEAEQRRKKQEVAATRAEQLLFAVISEDQRKQYTELGYFETVVNDRVYRIKKGRAGNVMQLDENGKPKFKYCIHPIEWVPDQDTMLTQFLLLMTDEQHFLKTANRTVLY
jgi:hypothetical protein